jgi:cell filamentation protein
MQGDPPRARLDSRSPPQVAEHMSPRYHTDEGSVPPNKFGIANLKDLQRIETPLALRRLLELQPNPVRGSFDTEHLRAIHRHMFQDVYEWAGELRTVNISKPGAIFPPPRYLLQNLDKLFAQLALEEQLGNLPASEWARRAAYFLGEINAIHPFREGNGRAQREFIRELASGGGHRLVWGNHTQQEMIDASRLSHLHRDYSGLERILANSIRAGS